MLFAAAAIKLTSPGKVFFRQDRATIGGRVFQIVKFRTMYDTACGAQGQSACENDGRITRVGRFLRKYRIDELPQLFNVLVGDMSIVGPRPEMLENVNRYTQEVPEFEYRNQMKAGLTGMAQIDGKYNTAPQDKVILDLLYIENFSLMMDLKLILRTATIFFRRDSTEGFQTDRKVFCPPMRTCACDAPALDSTAELPPIALTRENTPVETVLEAETLLARDAAGGGEAVGAAGGAGRTYAPIGRAETPVDSPASDAEKPRGEGVAADSTAAEPARKVAASDTPTAGDAFSAREAGQLSGAGAAL
jgi:lipopolysaccharide/colanic/teichoic acid biosynthesis glycosyltransferase